MDRRNPSRRSKDKAYEGLSQQSSTSGSSSRSAAKNENGNQSPSSSYLIQNSRKSKRWPCEVCTLLNSSRRKKCEVCGAARPINANLDSSSEKAPNRKSTGKKRQRLENNETVEEKTKSNSSSQSKCPKISTWVKGRRSKRKRPLSISDNLESEEVLNPSHAHESQKMDCRNTRVAHVRLRLQNEVQSGQMEALLLHHSLQHCILSNDEYFSTEDKKATAVIECIQKCDFPENDQNMGTLTDLKTQGESDDNHSTKECSTGIQSDNSTKHQNQVLSIAVRDFATDQTIGNCNDGEIERQGDIVLNDHSSVGDTSLSHVLHDEPFKTAISSEHDVVFNTNEKMPTKKRESSNGLTDLDENASSIEITELEKNLPNTVFHEKGSLEYGDEKQSIEVLDTSIEDGSVTQLINSQMTLDSPDSSSVRHVQSPQSSNINPESPHSHNTISNTQKLGHTCSSLSDLYTQPQSASKKDYIDHGQSRRFLSMTQNFSQNFEYGECKTQLDALTGTTKNISQAHADSVDTDKTIPKNSSEFKNDASASTSLSITDTKKSNESDRSSSVKRQNAPEASLSSTVRQHQSSEDTLQNEMQKDLLKAADLLFDQDKIKKKEPTKFSTTKTIYPSQRKSMSEVLSTEPIEVTHDSRQLIKQSQTLNLQNRNQNTMLARFTSAGGNTIKISEEARAKAADLFKDSDNHNNTRSVSKPSSLSAGFTSAGGNTIKISEEARAKAADLFKDSDNHNNTRSVSKPSSLSAGFTSAGGNTIKISEEARAKAADLFKDSDNHNNTRSVSKPSSLSAGFTSAGGNTIKISEEARAKAADLFKDSDNHNNTRNVSKPSSLSAGFTSAGGNTIKISEEARAKAADLFKDSDNHNNTRSVSKPSSLSAGFTSAGGNTIKISEEARAKAADLFKDSDNHNNTRSVSKPSSLSAGFTSAGGNTIKISEEARAKAADLFKDSDNHNNTRSVSKPSSLSAGFTSAGGNTIKISEEARAKAADLFKDSDNHNNTRSVSKPSSLSAGFTSAGGNTIKISEEARAKAADLFKDSDNHNNTRSVSKPSSLSAGFTSAGGNTIKISEEARAKAADLFKDSDNHNNTRSVSKPSSLSAGFTSAGGNTIKISEEARAKAADLFKDSDNHNNTRSVSKPSSLSAGFTSAGGNTIKISEEARAKAADLFKDSDNHNNTRSVSKPSSLSAGFTSAGGNTIKISEEARAKAADLFKDSDNHNNTRSVSKPSSLSAGFTSAGGNTIKISEEARAKAADLFKDSDNHNNTRSVSKPSSLSAGFTSAGGNTIKISEEARAKAADLFKDSDNYIDTRFFTVPSGLTSAGGSPMMSLVEEVLKHDLPMSYEVAGTEEACSDSSSVRNDLSSDRSLHSTSYVTEEVDYDVSKVLNFSINGSHISFSDSLACSTSSSTKKHLFENLRKGNPSHDQIHSLPIYDSSPEHNTAPLSTFINEVTKNNQYLLETARKKSIQRKTENLTSKEITFTPHQTPMLKHNIVTRSVENENIRPIHTKEKIDPVTPIPFNGFAETYQEIHEPSLQLRFDFAQHDLSQNDSKTITLDDLSKRYGQLDTTKQECVMKGVSEILCRVTPENSSRLRFDCFGNPIGFVGERDLSGLRVIGSVDDLRAKLITCGCKSSLLDNNWIANHYRWIVWKLASLERRFASLLARKYLTYDHIILQLRKRFKREIDTTERPLLRKILNRDVAASSPMVVCISKIIEDVKTKSVKLHVTDGWYEVPALIDESLQDFVKSKKLFVGSKIIACGASIEGAEEGIDPLDKYYPTAVRLFSVRLKLFANGTRICKWSTKLGYVKYTKSLFDQGGAFLTKSLDDVIEGGGGIPCIDLVVCRRYPLLYMEEQHVHGEHRKRVLTESENSAYQRSYEEERCKKAATLAETLNKEFLSEIDEDAPQTWKDMRLSSCTTTFFSTLDSNDQDILRDWEIKRGNLLHQRTQKEVMKELNESPSRSSRPFLRVLVASCPHKNMRKNEKFGIMTIWNPSEDQLNLMEEGTIIRCINLGVQSISDGKIQLSVNRNTTVRSLADDTNEELLQDSKYNPRRFDHLIMAEVASKCILKSPTIVLHRDVCGCLLKVIEIGSYIYMYLIDESQSVLRVEREIGDDCISSLRHWKDEILSLPRGSSLFFQDVQMVAFDLWEECSVAIWSEYTVLREDGIRMVELEDWFTQDGEAYTSLVCAKMSCGLLTHLPEDRKVAIGTLYSFELVEVCNSIAENETLRLRDFVWGVSMETVEGILQVAILPTHHTTFLEVCNSQVIKILDENFTVDEMKSIIDYINVQFETDANIYHTLSELETDEMISVTRISQAELAKLYMNSSTFN